MPIWLEKTINRTVSWIILFDDDLFGIVSRLLRNLLFESFECSCRQKNDGFKEIQDRSDSDPYQTKRDQKNPDDRIENKGQKRKRPTEN
jgi:hypothetical protein